MRKQETSKEMIKVEKTQTSESYWRNDGVYDNVRKTTHKVKLFGITIWNHSEDFQCDLTEDYIKKTGFKNVK